MNSDQAELQPLEEKPLMAKKDLSQVSTKIKLMALKALLSYLENDLGWAYLEYGKYEEGLELFKMLSWREHGEAKYDGMARALTGMGNYHEAQKLLKAGLRRFPKSYVLWVAKGILCNHLGDTFGFLDCIENSLRFGPENNSAGLYDKALTLMKLGCYGDALPILDELIERYPDDLDYLGDRGYWALEFGYPQEALQYYQKTLEIWQRNPMAPLGPFIYSGLCTAYLRLGMKREGLEIATEGLTMFPDGDPNLYLNLGVAYFEMGWRNDGMEILKKGIEKFPGDKDLKELLKSVEDEMDDSDKCNKQLLLGLIVLMLLIYVEVMKKR